MGEHGCRSCNKGSVESRHHISSDVCGRSMFSRAMFLLLLVRISRSLSTRTIQHGNALLTETETISRFKVYSLSYINLIPRVRNARATLKYRRRRFHPTSIFPAGLEIAQPIFIIVPRNNVQRFYLFRLRGTQWRMKPVAYIF